MTPSIPLATFSALGSRSARTRRPSASTPAGTRSWSVIQSRTAVTEEELEAIALDFGLDTLGRSKPLMLRELHYRLLRGDYGPAIAKIIAAGATQYTVTLADPIVSIDDSGTGSISALVSASNAGGRTFHETRSVEESGPPPAFRTCSRPNANSAAR